MGTVRDQLRLQVQTSDDFSRGWLLSILSSQQLTAMPGPDFRPAPHWWLDIPLVSGAGSSAACLTCGPPLDVFGDHAVSCAFNGFSARPRKLQMAFSSVLQEGGVPHWLEAQGAGTDHPVDFLIPYMQDGRPVAVDFAIVHSSHPLLLSPLCLSVRMLWRMLKRLRLLNTSPVATPWGGPSVSSVSVHGAHVVQLPSRLCGASSVLACLTFPPRIGLR